MTKITKATHVGEFVLQLTFSDGTQGEHDFAPLLARETSLTAPLKKPGEFERFFLDLGALCWPNGLELSPASLQNKMSEAGTLRQSDVA